ncbi:putative benzoate 4-monooxygenase cytochrome P450 [Aspergillus terreus]|uniref:Putative benzoate 4-monooxygenase cytochrome P450 n=1 Tax=Aspergillus terreus TaxID=33178 RepID=A0A5M3Z5Z2_ASPTE|nr:hypothetical protein ATETN484_0010021200 [Aspergillus terreus]GFF18259.1 putative benzoate 4-monooxygenase cytochrome P450 [Aspergillus terreus]
MTQQIYMDSILSWCFHMGSFIAWACVLAVPIWYLTAYLISPLRQFPGPVLAGWTNLWRMYHVRKGNIHVVVHNLHKKYGPVVRIAPGVLDLDLPDLVRTIYNAKGDFRKTEFYHVSSTKTNGKIIYNLFSERSPEQHLRQKRPIAKYYAMTEVLTLEPHVNEMIQCLCQRLEEEFVDKPKRGSICDLSEWMRYYTWDVVGKATFSNPFGYLQKGCDFDNTISIADQAMDYFALVAQLPVLDYVLDKNPVYRIGPPSFGNITTISIQQLMSRLQRREAGTSQGASQDFLDRFIDAAAHDSDTIDHGQIISWLMINMIAGADTTASTLNAVLYYSLKHPAVWSRLQHEIGMQEVEQDTVPRVLPFKHAHDVSYLEAVIREAMRMLPSVAMTLERYVPEGGLIIPDGRRIPGGCAVGMNPYILARNSSVWGERPDEFRPERWLRDTAHESEAEYQERLQRMNNTDLVFGGGSRVCLGKNFALVQIYKVLATLVSRYDIELASPDREWSTYNSFFIRQSGLYVRMSRRRK